MHSSTRSALAPSEHVFGRRFLSAFAVVITIYALGALTALAVRVIFGGGIPC